MTWTEVKIEGYDFCLESGKWQIRRKGGQVGLWHCNYRIEWCNSVRHGMFTAWALVLRKERESRKVW